MDLSFITGGFAGLRNEKAFVRGIRNQETFDIKVGMPQPDPSLCRLPLKRSRVKER